MTKLTHAEHTARAMLMGRVYDWRDGTYCFHTEGYEENALASLTFEGAIDALSLEPLDQDTIQERAIEWGGEYNYSEWGDIPKPTPYADK